MIGISYFLRDARLPSLRCPVVAHTQVRKLPAVCFYHSMGLMCLCVPCVIHTHASHGYSSCAKSPNFEPVQCQLQFLNQGFWAPALSEHSLVYAVLYLLPHERWRI
jgi:hypothetical protein